MLSPDMYTECCPSRCPCLRKRQIFYDDFDGSSMDGDSMHYIISEILSRDEIKDE